MGRKATTISGSTRVADSRDRKSTRLNSSHSQISYAVFCLKQKKVQDAAKAIFQRLVFGILDEANAFEHGCMSNRTPHIVANQVCIARTVLCALAPLYLVIQ